MADKYLVADKTTLTLGGKQFPAGAEVTAEKLGLQKKQFNKLIDDGTVVVKPDGRKRASEHGGQQATGSQAESRQAEE